MAADTDWTAADMPALRGRNVIITGANSGIGYRAALSLAAKGAHVILACRDARRGQAAIETIRREVPDADVAVALLDLAALSSCTASPTGFWRMAGRCTA